MTPADATPSHALLPLRRLAAAVAALAALSMTADLIARFLMNPHPKMPDMQLSRDEADDLAAYIVQQAK